MRKILLLITVLFSVIGYSQGHETFENLAISGTSYQDGVFLGQDGSTWTFGQCRGDFDITGQAITLGRNRDTPMFVESGIITGGVGTIQFSYMQAFGTNVNMSVFINDNLIYTATSNNEVNVVKSSGPIIVDLDDDFTIKFTNTSGGQVTIDDIVWTAFDGTAPQVCLPPTNLAVDNITLDSADVTWTAGGTETEWIVSYGLQGFDPDTGNLIIPAVMPEATIEDLDENTTYDVYVQAACEDLTYSNWVGPMTFTTLSDQVPASFQYQLITSETELEAGVKYLIVSKNVTGDAQALGHQAGNNRPKADISIENAGGNFQISTGVATDPGDTNIPYALTLGEGNQYWTLFDEVNNGYLYAPSSSANQLKTRANNDDLNSEWEITIDVDGDATIIAKGTNTRNWLRYNSSASIFSLYAGGQLAVYLYKEVATSGSVEYVYEDGVWTPANPSGVATQNDNIAIINGSDALLNADTQVKHLTVLAGAKLTVDHNLELYGNMTVNGDLVFRSTATSDGELGYVSPTATITGDVTVERYLQDRRAYRILSSSVTTSTSIHANWQEGASANTHDPSPGYGTHITGTSIDQENGFDATETGNPSMFTLDIPNADWVEISNTTPNTLTVGQPYLMLVRGDRSVDLTNNDSHSATTLRAKGTLRGGAAFTENFTTVTTADTFVIFGNPYQSTVNVNQLFAAASNVNTNFYYIYDPMKGAQGGYVTIALPGGTNADGSTANEFLQPGQGAMFTTAANGPASLTFTEGTKAPGNRTATNANGNGFTDANRINVQLFTAENFTSGNRSHDGFVMMFDPNYDNAINLLDARKPMNLDENMAVNNDGALLSIERRNMPITSEVYQLFTNNYRSENYTISVVINGLEDKYFFLDDAYTGTATLLNVGETVYNFTVNASNASKATDRFSVRVESSLGVTDHVLSGIRLFPNPTNSDTFYIHAPKLNGEQVAISIADITGRQIYNDTLSANSNKLTINTRANLSTGVYLVTVKFAGEAQTYRLVKE